MDERRESTVTITVTESEREELKRRAKEARLTVSGYCRIVLFGGMSLENEK